MALKPIGEWGVADARAATEAGLPKDYDTNRKLVEEKDAWQGGALWPGSRSGNEKVDATNIANVAKSFSSDDVIGEGLDNRSDGLVGQEADITLVPVVEDAEVDPADEVDEATEAEIAGIIAAFSAWWDRVGLWLTVRRAIDKIGYAGRCSLWAYVPTGKLVGGKALPQAGTLADALDNIAVDAPLPSRAIRYTDPKDNSESAVIITTIDDKDVAQVWTKPAAPAGNDQAQQITVKVLSEQGAGQSMGPFDLKGRLPLAVATGKRIVTPSVVDLQKQLNFITTITTRTVETAGVRERYLGNVDPPGLWLPFPPSTEPPLDQEQVGSTTMYKHRTNYVLGANITTELQGVPIRTVLPDGTEREEYATPFVQALDPVNPQYATDAASVVTRRLYRRMKQGHLGTDSTAEASGTAYIQARAQFEGDLNGMKAPVELLLRDLLEAVLALAGLMHPASAGLLDKYRFQVTLYPNAGPVTQEEANLAATLRDKRLISQQTAVARSGSDDPAAEQDLIDADPTQNASKWSSIGLALSALMQLEGMTVLGAAALLHLSVEDATILLTGMPPKGDPLAELESLQTSLAATPTPGGTEPGNEPPQNGNGTNGGNAGNGARPVRGAAAIRQQQAERPR